MEAKDIASKAVKFQWLVMDLLQGPQGEWSCLQPFWIIVAWWQKQQGWVRLAQKTAKPASSHPASANLPLSVDSSTDVLAF